MHPDLEFICYKLYESSKDLEKMKIDRLWTIFDIPEVEAKKVDGPKLKEVSPKEKALLGKFISFFIF